MQETRTRERRRRRGGDRRGLRPRAPKRHGVAGERRGLPPDKEEVRGEVLAVCIHYLGPGKQLGTRTTWTCPGCGKEKFDAHASRGIAGCWNAGCEVPGCDDALGIVAYFEGLGDARGDFPRIVQKAHEIAGVGRISGGFGGTGASPPRPRHGNEGLGEGAAANGRTDPEVENAVYRRILGLCPPRARSKRFWASRGVTGETVVEGRFGEATPRAMRRAVEDIEKAFGRARVLGVPGFFLKEDDGPDGGGERLSFTLVGDYAIIPYHDREGRITALEGRALTPFQVGRTGKYVSLRGSANHLYVYPRFSPDDLSAFCEGSIGAIVAAQECGLAVGAVQGKRRYLSQAGACRPGGGAPPPGSSGGVLPELEGTRGVWRGDGGPEGCLPYVPDRDVSEELALETARALAGQVGARPAVVRPPGLGPGSSADDLDGWLLSLGREERRAALRRAVFFS